MPIGTYSPGASGDDSAFGGGDFWPSSGEMSCCGGFDVFFRFRNVAIANGSTINSAKVSWRATNNQNAIDSDVDIYGNDVDDAVAPTSYAQAAALVLTTAKVDYDNLPQLVTYDWYDSPDITSIIEEIIGRPGWVSGNDIIIVFQGISGTQFTIAGIDLGFDSEADLVIDYSAPAPTEIEAEITEGFTTSDVPDAFNLTDGISEGFSSSDATVGMNTTCKISEGFKVNALLGGEGEGEGEGEADFTTDDAASAVKEQYPVEEGESLTSDDALAVETETTLAEGVTSSDEIDVGTEVIVPEGASSSDEIDVIHAKYVTINETLNLYGTLGWAWGKTNEETLAFTEAVDKILSIPVNDPLTLEDVAVSNWTGTESVESTLQFIGSLIVGEIFNETNSETLTITDVPTYLHKMISAIADSLGITEAVTAQAEFNPEIIEAIAITGLVEVLSNLFNANEETLTLTDTLGVGWGKTLAETLTLTDTATPLFYAMAALTDSIAFTEAVLHQFQVDESISDVIEFATTLALQQILTNTVEDTLDFEITVELDGELWECWVLNTNAFHASVYSGYDFNSFAVDNDIAYGCKPDGIYRLDGDTDDGDAFKSGLVLPESRFGTPHFKRFRKAYFGLAGGTTPAIKMENEDGTSNTYTIANSKATPTRGVKGRRWTVSVGDFDSLDFVELVPLWLVR